MKCLAYCLLLLIVTSLLKYLYDNYLIAPTEAEVRVFTYEFANIVLSYDLMHDSIKISKIGHKIIQKSEY